MSETNIKIKKRSHLEEASSQCEYNNKYKSPCKSNALYQIWDEKELEEIGTVNILLACQEHTEEIKSELHNQRTGNLS